MTIYAKKLSKEWRKAFTEYESICGFEPMYQEDIDADKITPRDAWNQNVRWIRDVADSCSNIKTPCDD